MKAATTCSVIIRCLNEAEHLPHLLDSIARQTFQPTEVIVVDSGSRDNTVQIARSKGARLIEIQPQEFTFGRALNLGAASAVGEVLVIVSAHTYPTTDRWLEFLMEPFDQPDVALVYGGQTGDQRSKFSELQLFRQWFPSESCDNQAHSFCNNANSAIRRSVWETMPYDEQIPALEDIHWAKRAIERGLRISYRSAAMIAHVHEEPYLKVYNRYRREGMGLRLILPWERMGLWQACMLAAHAIRSDLKEAGMEGRLLEVAGSIVRFRVAQYWGTYRGLNWRGPLTGDLRARLYYPKNYELREDSSSKGNTEKPLPSPVAGKRID